MIGRKKKLKIMIVDDHRVVCDGLERIIKTERDMDVVALAEDGSQAREKAIQCRPDLIVMDVRMPQMGGIIATREILLTPELQDTQILALSMYSDMEFVVGMFKAGAKGFVLKNNGYKEVVGAIRKVAAGELFLDPGLIGVSMSDVMRAMRQPPDWQQLTENEKQVVRLVSMDYSNQQIANELGVSVKTVEKYRHDIREKKGIKVLR